MVEYQELRFKVGLAWRGGYSAASVYKKADVVVTDAGVYVSKKGGNVGHELTDEEWWSVLIDASHVKAAADRGVELNEAVARYLDVASAAEDGRSIAENSRRENELERLANEQERADAEELRKEEHEDRMESAGEAIMAAQELAEHPTYVGEDYYVYTYNVLTHRYDKSNVFVKGEGFSIAGTFPSIAVMNASGATEDGKFYMVVSNVEDEDNGKLYVKDGGQMKFIVDLSGVRGFTGKTPQISIGSVSAGNGIYSAGASLTHTGYDGDGNPSFQLSLTLPRLAYNNFTESQIAELQKPATDAAEELRRMAAEGVFDGAVGATGPMGPMGPMGPAGPAGADGVVPEEELAKIAELDSTAARVVMLERGEFDKSLSAVNILMDDATGVIGDVRNVVVDGFGNAMAARFKDAVTAEGTVTIYAIQLKDGLGIGAWFVKDVALLAQIGSEAVEYGPGTEMYEIFCEAIDKAFGDGGMTDEEKAKLTALDLKVGELEELVKSYDLDVISSMLDELNGTSNINGQLDELNS